MSSGSGTPLRALAAAVVLRAVRDAFCGNTFRPKVGACGDAVSCEHCKREALNWLLGDWGAQMIEWAGMDADAVVSQIVRNKQRNLTLRAHSKSADWITEKGEDADQDGQCKGEGPGATELDLYDDLGVAGDSVG